jgi:hypothetical protein
MDDLERRLRAALRSVSEPPPPGLLAAIRRRHTRHVRRVGVSGVAAVAVIAAAATPVVHALRPSAPSGLSGRVPASQLPGWTPSPPTYPRFSVPGAVARDCQDNNNGTLGSKWRTQSVHAGPVWFVYAREGTPWGRSRHLSGGMLSGQAGVVAIRNGSAAVISVAPDQAAHFRFLAAFDGSDRYTMRDGEPRLALKGCPSTPVGKGIPASYAPGLTMFWQGYVTDLGNRDCVHLRVRIRPSGRTIQVALPGSRHGCQRR